jgi:hypothetical protein
MKQAALLAACLIMVSSFNSSTLKMDLDQNTRPYTRKTEPIISLAFNKKMKRKKRQSGKATKEANFPSCHSNLYHQ